MTISRPEGSSGRRALRRLPPSVVPITYANRDATIESLETFRSRAVRDGYEDGYADGQARARLEAERQREEQAARVDVALSSLERAISRANDIDLERRRELQSAASELAFMLLEELLARELALSSNPGRDAITRALSLDQGNELATVRLHPDDLATLGELADLGVSRPLDVRADTSIERGGAVVEIGRTTLDGQLASALERVRRVLVAEPNAVVP